MYPTQQINDEGFEGIPQPSAPPISPSPLQQPQYNNPPQPIIIKIPQRNNMDKYVYQPRNKQAYYARRNVYVEKEKNKKSFLKGCAALFCCLFCCCPPCFCN